MKSTPYCEAIRSKSMQTRYVRKLAHHDQGAMNTGARPRLALQSQSTFVPSRVNSGSRTSVSSASRPIGVRRNTSLPPTINKIKS